MSDKPDDDLIEPGILLRLRRPAAWLFLMLMLAGNPGALVVLWGVVLGVLFRNVALRLASRRRLFPGWSDRSRISWGTYTVKNCDPTPRESTEPPVDESVRTGVRSVRRAWLSSLTLPGIFFSLCVKKGSPPRRRSFLPRCAKADHVARISLCSRRKARATEAQESLYPFCHKRAMGQDQVWDFRHPMVRPE
jgi:hypothetical protein